VRAGEAVYQRMQAFGGRGQTFDSRNLRAQILPTPVNSYELAVAEDELRVCVELRYALRDHLWRAQVVCALPFEIFTACELHQTIVIPCGSAIYLLAVVMNTMIFGGILTAEIGRASCRERR